MDLRFGQIIILAAAVAFIFRLYFAHAERRRRLEILHQERLAAIEKGIPLPELPLEPPAVVAPPDASSALFPGVILVTFGLGAMLAFLMTRGLSDFWMLPLPLLFMGIGMFLYHVFSVRPRLRR